jgi:hypothetical protein
MLTGDQINNIHRLHAERWSLRRIAHHLQMDLRTVKKYLLAPAQKLSGWTKVLQQFLEPEIRRQDACFT